MIHEENKDKLADQDCFRLRPATAEDCWFFFDLRNDPLTRANSFTASVFGRPEHAAWYAGSLESCERSLFVFEYRSESVAVLRLDSKSSKVSELSWIVAPSARGQGVGKRLLIEARKLSDGILVAQIKESNLASAKIARSAGFILTLSHSGNQVWVSVPAAMQNASAEFELSKFGTVFFQSGMIVESGSLSI
jgi:RimJ/RimL family protein N-acetyltransferase